MISSIGRAFALHANGFVFKSRIILFQTNKVCSETEDFEPFLEIPTELECYAFRSDTFPRSATGALTTGALVFNFRGVAAAPRNLPSAGPASTADASSR